MKLPSEQREALHLIAVEDLSYQQAANTLGVPIGTLMSRVSRARATLRNF
jgi:RNA polymerase sigma-70 factor, ECF subfamily